MRLARVAGSAVLLTLVAAPAFLRAQSPQYPNYPSEMPDHLQPVTSSFDYARREAMIPMRDGVHLHTVILVPKGAAHAPILLTRTPYSADQLTSHSNSAHLGPNLYGYDNAVDVILENDVNLLGHDQFLAFVAIVGFDLVGPQLFCPILRADAWQNFSYCARRSTAGPAASTTANGG